MEIDFGTRSQPGLKRLNPSDPVNAVPRKIGLLSAGALLRLCGKAPVARPLAGLVCTLLTVGAAAPLIAQRLNPTSHTVPAAHASEET